MKWLIENQIVMSKGNLWRWHHALKICGASEDNGIQMGSVDRRDLIKVGIFGTGLLLFCRFVNFELLVLRFCRIVIQQNGHDRYIYKDWRMKRKDGRSLTIWAKFEHSSFNDASSR